MSLSTARYETAHYPVKEAHEAGWARRIALFFVQLLILTVLLHRFASLTTPAALNLVIVSIAGLFIAIGIAVFALVRIWFGGQIGAAQAFAAILIALLGLTVRRARGRHRLRFAAYRRQARGNRRCGGIAGPYRHGRVSPA